MTWLQPVSIAQLLDFAAAHPGPFTGHTEEATRRDPQTTHRLRREADRRASIREARTTGH